MTHDQALVAAVRRGHPEVPLVNRQLQVDRSEPFLTVFLPNSWAIGPQIGQQPVSLRSILATCRGQVFSDRVMRRIQGLFEAAAA